MVYYQESRSKYGNISQTYEGRTYHSKFEASIARDLDIARKAADPREKVVDWTPQYKVELRSPTTGKLMAKYYCDFFVEYADGRKELLEAKGMETEVYRLKRRMLEELWLPEHPDIEYRVVKEKADKEWLRQQRKKQYARAKAWKAEKGLR